MAMLTMRIFIVQPGVSKGEATTAQLELLSVTENYLMETFRLPFAVIASTDGRRGDANSRPCSQVRAVIPRHDRGAA
jgi:hypothetical protein